MTRFEFIPEFQRLCQGHRFEPTPIQVESFYKELKAFSAQPFSMAVDRLLCGLRFPKLDDIRAACDQASEELRRKTLLRERSQSDQWMKHGPASTGRIDQSPKLKAYNAFRSSLLCVSVAGHSRRSVAEIHVNGLADWLDCRDNVEWARTEPIGNCGHHHGPHTLLQCLTDELRFWLDRSNGKSEREATQELVGVGAP